MYLDPVGKAPTRRPRRLRLGGALEACAEFPIFACSTATITGFFASGFYVERELQIMTNVMAMTETTRASWYACSCTVLPRLGPQGVYPAHVFARMPAVPWTDFALVYGPLHRAEDCIPLTRTGTFGIPVKGACYTLIHVCIYFCTDIYMHACPC